MSKDDPQTIAELAAYLREEHDDLRREAEEQAYRFPGRAEQTEFLALYAKNQSHLLGVVLTRLLKILENTP